MIKHLKPSLILLVSLLTGLFTFSACIPTGSGETPTTQGFDWTFLVFIVIIIIVFYFLMIRPQRTRQNQQRKMLSELKPGDRVITVGGLYGEVASVDEVTIVLLVESGAKIRVARASIARIRSENM